MNSSLAILGNESKLYDFSVNKTYEVETGPLNSDEAAWIDQLCSSHDIIRIKTDTTIGEKLFVPAIITESTCEISNTDEKLQSVKFTWRYTDKRPHISMSASPGIFTEQYTYPFSRFATAHHVKLHPYLNGQSSAQLWRPCGYFRMEIRRLNPGTPQRRFTPLLVLRRMAQREATLLRRDAPHPRHLHLPSQQPRSFPLKYH